MNTSDNRSLRCVHCDRELDYIKREDIQLGKQSIWHDWNHILHGSLEVDIFACPKCGKIEFFMPSSYLAKQTDAETDAPPGQIAAGKNARPAQIVARKCTECGTLAPDGATYCPVCGEEGLLLPQIKCPVCGALHDFDDPKCPYCKT